MDAPQTTDKVHTSRIGSGQPRAASGSAPVLTASARLAESRDQLLARRRAAQRAWRSACEGAERASQYLHAALSAPHSPGAATARQRLEHAQHGERLARTFYYRVAQETGTLLSRLERTDIMMA